MAAAGGVRIGARISYIHECDVAVTPAATHRRSG
eukprot:SAG11_NODE_12601_length_695_cov_0.906040_1_plen_33_part_01